MGPEPSFIVVKVRSEIRVSCSALLVTLSFANIREPVRYVSRLALL